MSTTESSNDNMNRTRRGSVGNAVFSNLFQRSATTGSASIFPAAAANMNDANRRRLSVSTLGIHGTSPSNASIPYHYRRGSMSTNSDCIDESAIEEDDGSARTAPPTPFTRRMSFGANTRGFRTGGTSPGTDQGAFNWSEQLRTRAESSVTGSRPSFSYTTGLGSSPPRVPQSQHQDTSKSVSEMPAPPSQPMKPKQPERMKPDPFQERILKGDFYMD